MSQTRRSVLATLAGVTTVGVAGCNSGRSIEKVNGITTIVPQVYEVELGEYEYAAIEFQAQRPLTYVAAFRASEGEMAVLLLKRQQFWNFEEGRRFEGRWDVNDTDDFIRVRNQFRGGETFVLVADNTGTVGDHTVDEQAVGRVETRAIR